MALKLTNKQTNKRPSKRSIRDWQSVFLFFLYFFFACKYFEMYWCCCDCFCFCFYSRNVQWRLEKIFKYFICANLQSNQIKGRGLHYNLYTEIQAHKIKLKQKKSNKSNKPNNNWTDKSKHSNSMKWAQTLCCD